MKSKDLIKCINSFRSVDLFIGALEENQITQNRLIASRSYYHDAYHWCVSKRIPIPLWKHFFHICTDRLAYAIFFVESIVVLSCAYYGQQFERTATKWDWNYIVINAFRSYLGFPCTLFPKSNILRIGYISCLFAGIIFTTVTTSMFVLFVTVPKLGSQIQSVEEIIREKFTLMGEQIVLHHILLQNEVNNSFITNLLRQLYLLIALDLHRPIHWN